MARKQGAFDFLEYLASDEACNGDEDPNRLPSLQELSKETGVSIASLREQLEVARALGLVEVRPRTGIRRLAYTFTPTVSESLSYAIALDRSNFERFADLRMHVETAYWNQAVSLLRPEDHEALRRLIDRAYEKLHGDPIEIPHPEHRELHMAIFRHLKNPFVLGILEAYWNAYEDVGLNLYEGLDYLEKVWDYHRRIVSAICVGDFDSGHQLHVEHMELIQLIDHPRSIQRD